MVHHGFVPDIFCNGVIIPLVNDKQCELCNIDNYRGITLSPFLQNFLNIVSLTNTITYCCRIISNLVLSSTPLVLTSFLCYGKLRRFFLTLGGKYIHGSMDAKTAFDRMHHLKLFNVLFDRKIPFYIIKAIVNCYSKTFVPVRLNSAFSNMLPIKSLPIFLIYMLT